ncbi:outer membrane protein TolC [Comamonadaceae bacterium OS-1]|nr:outer membrane protein TolC [Comamonadaceae bacterium OS-1]
MRKIWLAGFLLSCMAAHASGLLEAYQQALDNDPTLRAARYEREAGRLNPAIARAALLPNVSFSSSRSSNQGDRSLAPGAPAQDLKYRSSQDALSLRQALYNGEGNARYRQGLVQSEYSEFVFLKKQDDLAVRVAGAYFDLLLAAEKLAFANAEVNAFSAQQTSAERRYTGGEGTVTEIAEASARGAIAEANRADATDLLLVARQALEAMTGQPALGLQVLKPGFSPTTLQPDTLEAWTVLALDKNPDIAAQRKLLESTRLDIQRSRAGHLPRLDLVASISKSTSDSLTTLNQQSTIRSVGVQLTIPLFAGLGVVAQTDQAVANLQRAEAELDASTLKVQLDLRRWFLATRTGITKVAAYDRAVESSRVAVEGTQRGLAAGIRTQTEVLDAERQYFSALRDRAQARYEFLNNRLKLKATAGVLEAADIAEVDLLLETESLASKKP